MNDLSNPIEPINVSSMNFRQKEILTAILKNDQGYVSLRSLCDALSIGYKGQSQRLFRSSHFRKQALYIRIPTKGGPQSMLCLAAVAVPLFMSGFRVEQVEDEEVKEYFEAFLNESQDVLAEHFGISEAGEMRYIRLAVAQLIAEHEAMQNGVMDIQKKVEEGLREQKGYVEDKLTVIRDVFAGLRGDVRRVEQHVGPKARVTPEQKFEIKKRVDRLAELKRAKNPETNPYPAIYSGINGLAGVSKYAEIRQDDYQMVVGFLEEEIDAADKGAMPDHADLIG